MLSFKYCPICSGELETGKIKFPAPLSILDVIESEGKYYSDKNSGKLFKKSDKHFSIQTDNQPAGYCQKCNRIFTEFEVKY
ncbi:MAG: hypothetical protein K2G36_09175 [Ruminococcus sp.]|nr:hypothetical protein [Ruminococcus sp.]